MKKALIDASSVVILFKSDLLDHMIHFYDVIMAGVVYEELTVFPYPGSGRVTALNKDGKLKIIDSEKRDKNSRFQESDLARLGSGEKETIHLYYQGQGDFIIIDDGKGAGFCRDHRIPYINALLFPRILYLKNILSKAEYAAYSEKIVQCGRYSETIIDYAKNCPFEDLQLFLPK